MIFTDGFEGLTGPTDLFPADGSRWHSAQIEPKTKPSSQIDLSTRAHTGEASLKFTARPSAGATSKCDLVRDGLTFVKGDHVYSEVWYWLERGPAVNHPCFLWDLESTKTGVTSPGRRLYLTGVGDWITSDLGKWPTGEVFRQDPAHSFSFPKDTWVRLRVHMLLSQGTDGHMEVWQDENKVLDGWGQTLPTAEAVYDRWQIGITANGDARYSQILYADDVMIGDEPFE